MMRTLTSVALFVLVRAIVGDGPTGSYCGSPHTPVGDAVLKITVTSSSTFSIEASWTPRGGETKSGSETGVGYQYYSPTGDVTVTSLDKLQDLIDKIGAPLSAEQLAHLKLKDNTLYVTNLGSFVVSIMRILINFVLSTVVCAIVGNGPTGSYCGAPDTPFGKATFKITVTSSSAFNVEGSWTPTGGETKSVRETGLEYTYEASTGDVTVKSVDKLGDLIKKLGVPISADQLAKLNYKDNTLYVTQLGNYPLKAC
ncbi:hypothetical protein FOL47_008034 [Perkinsus chesapeaki]|uniref:Uncharacterized protein n=1 Tax=Perkinsus chesapeaki TaxID=330153 RepID=A0A7J6N393_PERCH|nr:hypothetical protein FOL47_008034 [Perkinsus chesapeaki]